MTFPTRFERLKSRRKRNETRPVRLSLETMEDRTVPAQAVAVGPNLSLYNFGPNSGAKVGDSLYFLAHQNTDSAGVSEIWQVSGTSTAQELNVPALAGMSIDEIANVGGTLYVTASSTPTVPPPLLPVGPSNVNLWKIDPTAAGGATELTSFTDSGAAELQVVGNKLFFEHTSFTGNTPSQSSSELWASDGTVAGTQIVHAFSGDAHPDLIDAAAAGGDLYFQVNAFNAPAAPVLWVSDGTNAGTQAVAAAGGGSLAPLNGFSLTAAGNSVYFATTHGNEADLWSAQNGQASLVQAFNGQPASATAPVINNITAANGSIYFALYRNSGVEIWTSDGTTIGTTPVYQSPAGAPPAVPPPGGGGATPTPTPTPYVGDIAVLDGSVYFTLVNGGGLMKADGAGGAAAVPLPSNLSGFSYLSTVGDRLYFMADDGVHGTEMWSTDGTASGAVRLSDINPGSGSSYPIGPEEAGGGLYVVASDGVPTTPSTFAAEQLWLLPDPSTPAGAAATTTLTTGANAVVTGGTVTLTATVASADPTKPAPTGEVVFRDDFQVYGSAPLINGTATLAATIEIPGTHDLRAVYTGDAVFDESISASATVTAGPSATQLTLTSSSPTANPGQMVTFTAKIVPAQNGPLAPTGSVNFFDGTTFLGTGFVNAGVATFQTSALAAGTHTVTADYGGDSTYLPSASVGLTQTIGPAFTVGLSAPTSTSTFGQPVTLTAQVSATPGSTLPPGTTVIFRDAATPLGTVVVNANGMATLTVSNLGVGAHSLSAAIFNSGAEYDSTAIPMTVTQAKTSASLHSTAPTVRQGQNITLTLTLTTPAGLPAPTGIVTFKDGATVLGTAIVANNRAVLLVSNLAVGTHPLTASYQGDGIYTGSSATLSETVTGNVVATTITVTPPASTAIAGQQVALSATITPAVGAATPVGSVSFLDGANLLAAVKIDPTGHALLLTSSLATGNHTITAVFGGSGIFAGSTSAPVSIAVRLGAAATLKASAGSITAGQGVALTATVGATSGSAVQPSGNVTFYDGSTALGTAPIQNGVAKLNTVPLTTIGVHRLTAVYGGNSLFATVGTGTVYLTVRSIGTTTTLQNPAPPAAGTGAVTLTAKVADVAPGTGAATGKVTFYSGSTVLGTANVAGGVAALKLSKLVPGSYFLRAVFAGTGEFAGSSSAIVHYTIAATTATTLQAAPAAFGQTTTLKATVAVLSPGFGKANGKVTFKDGATVLGTAEVVNGIATLGAKLSTGAHHLTATYVGTTDFAASGAVALPYTVTKAAATLSLRATPGSAKAGTNITVTASAGAAAPGAAGPTGTILLTDGATIMGVGTITHGVVSLQTTKLTKGTHTLKATYSGDGNYLAETATMSLTII